MSRFSWNIEEALNITGILPGVEFPRLYPWDDYRFSLRNKGFDALTQVLVSCLKSPAPENGNLDGFAKSPIGRHSREPARGGQERESRIP